MSQVHALVAATGSSQDLQVVRITPIHEPFKLGHLEGEQPYLGDLLTMVINHLLSGMILQVGIERFHVLQALADGQLDVSGHVCWAESGI